jgi:glycosyltransferase involved in cell wall biosynthesis
MTHSNPDISFFQSSMIVGGAQRVFANLVRSFDSKGYNVDLVLTEKKGEFLKNVPRTVRIVELNSPRMLTSFPNLTWYLKRNSPKALLATTGANKVASFVNTYYKNETNITIRLANTPDKESQEKMNNIFMNNYYPNADSIITLSNDAKAFLSNECNIREEKIKTILNPVDIDRITNMSERPLKEDFQAPIIMAVGSLINQKDFSTLIRSFALVKDEINSNLVIAGEGENRRNLNDLSRELGIEENVHLMGYEPNPYKYVAKSSVFVLSSAWEGCPNVLLEALACGTPVISTDCPGASEEILNGGEYGPLVPVGDHTALAQQILRTMKNPLSSEKLQSRAEDFSIETVSEKYEEVLI